ncbi:MAG: hypothetical protein IJ325_01250 [Clostridia bacterium]|nr:hypothetical protein [Clostridia bacterium]
MSVSYFCETLALAGDSSKTRTFRWWTASNQDISVLSMVRNNQGSTVANWGVDTAVNGVLFPLNGINNTVNAFAIDGSTWAINGCNINYEDAAHTRPFDFLMDPIDKRGTESLIFFGNGGELPVNSVAGPGDGYSNITLSDINWGIGGLDLELSNSNYDNKSTFNLNWKWRDCCGSPSYHARTAIGYIGGSYQSTDFIIATCEECTMYDIRMFLKQHGCGYFGIYLDGGDSTSATNDGTVVISSTRRIPTIIALS